MNIFILDEDPVVSAQMQNDWHVCKIPLEIAQMLCTALHRHAPDLTTPMKPAHKNHPVTLWVGDTCSNFQYAIEHGMALLDEHYWRHSSNKRVCKSTGKPHKAEEVIQWAQTQADLIPDGPLDPFAQAMLDQYKNPDDPVIAYWDYYLNEKSRNDSGKCAPWTKREPPVFWTKLIPNFDPNWRNPCAH